LAIIVPYEIGELDLSAGWPTSSQPNTSQTAASKPVPAEMLLRLPVAARSINPRQ
jgi:hypothetical protein